MTVMDKVLVTGATGFIGSHLVKALVNKKDKKIRVLVKKGEPQDILNGLDVEIFTGDLLDMDSLEEALCDVDIVYHCAAYTKSKPLSMLLKVNVDGTKNLFQIALEKKVTKIIYLSSVEVINGNPGDILDDTMPYAAENDYGISKIEAEKIALEYRNKGLKIAILRPCMVYGPGEPHFFNWILRLLKLRMMFIVGNGDGLFPLVYVDDVVQAMILSEENINAFDTTYIITGDEIPTVKEFFGLVAQELGVRKPWHIPRWIVWIPAVLCEWITNTGLLHMPFTRAKINSFNRKRRYDISWAKKKLGYMPQVGIYEGIRNSIKR
jgi:nucleoside-diphosphate-sugar epimerase